MNKTIIIVFVTYVITLNYAYNVIIFYSTIGPVNKRTIQGVGYVRRVVIYNFRDLFRVLRQ